MTWFVHRRSDGAVASAHRELRPGYAEEPLADDDAEIVAIVEEPRRRAEARKQLDEIDRETVRVMREEMVARGLANAELVDLNDRAATERSKLRT